MSFVFWTASSSRAHWSYSSARLKSESRSFGYGVFDARARVSRAYCRYRLTFPNFSLMANDQKNARHRAGRRAQLKVTVETQHFRPGGSLRITAPGKIPRQCQLKLAAPRPLRCYETDVG